MSEPQTTGSLDFQALRHAIEERDAEALASLYAEDAELHRVNRYDTPSSPRVLSGKEEIAEYLRDVFGRDMTHRVQDEVIGEERIAFQEACEYPDGTRVLAAMSLDVRDGKITRHVNVEAWDETEEEG
jgi:ketosteroid isomerase-like protein